MRVSSPTPGGVQAVGRVRKAFLGKVSGNGFGPSDGWISPNAQRSGSAPPGKRQRSASCLGSDGSPQSATLAPSSGNELLMLRERILIAYSPSARTRASRKASALEIAKPNLA